jgi:hypothetical protein
MEYPEKPETSSHYLELLIQIVRDTAVTLKYRSSSFDRDIASLRRRHQAEGMSFLTKTLPKLGKAFDKALSTDTTFVVPPEFRARKYGTMKIPVLFGPLWKLVFSPDGCIRACDGDTEDRRLYRQFDASRTGNFEIINDDLPPFAQPSSMQIAAVRAIRQICYLAYKLELPYTEEVEQQRIDSFLEIDAELPQVSEDVPLTKEAYSALENANLLLSYVLRDLNPAEIVPKHGPGAVATGEKVHEKFNFKRIFSGVGKFFDIVENFFFNYTHLCDELDSLEAMEEIPESCTKVELVPKDSRGPRLIAMEPLETQWIQQGLAREIIDIVEDSRSITHGFVNFTDQTVNRALALEHSMDGEFVTIDLSDASDRVSEWLVRRVFNGRIGDYLCSCRSNATILPDGRRVELRKYASMGSALCFPVEALVFWALAVGSLTRLRTARDLRSLPPVYVYGDDIVVRKCDYEQVGLIFEQLHLKLSEGKCCTGRFFRESCGCDAFKGVDVTPVRLHTLWPTAKSPEALLSYVAYANNLFAKPRRCVLGAVYIQEQIEGQFGRHPRGQQGCIYPLAFWFPIMDERRIAVYNSRNHRTRYNSDLQRFEFKLRSFRPRVIDCADELGWANMYKVLTYRDDPFGFHPYMSAGSFTIPRIVKSRWTWVGLEDLLYGK